jgi:hypothetical protein
MATTDFLVVGGGINSSGGRAGLPKRVKSPSHYASPHNTRQSSRKRSSGRQSAEAMAKARFVAGHAPCLAKHAPAPAPAQ